MIMKNEQLINNVLNGFQNNKGFSSIYCFINDIIPKLTYEVINKFNVKHKNECILIVVDDFNRRQSILNEIKKNNINYESEFNIKILSYNYINEKYRYDYKLIITIGLNDNLNLLTHLKNNTKFMLSILTKNIMDNDFIINLRYILPNINVNFDNKEVEIARIYSPVKEYQIGVEFNEDDSLLYEKYTDFINKCIKIFGDVSVIEKCKNGDRILNISSSEYRYNLAKMNGWHEELDVNIEFQKQIDDIYNPNVLLEKANTFYNITKQRRDLVSDNVAKLEAILNIVKNNFDKKILIVSKRGEFATKITNYINANLKELINLFKNNFKSNVNKDSTFNYETVEFEISNDLIIINRKYNYPDGDVCKDYHDNIEECVATNPDGSIVLIKSGENKGKPKILQAQAISSYNEKLYNANGFNILSLKNSSNKKLTVDCDIVIFTSPICDNIFDFKTRFSNINFISNPNIVYRLYCENSIEKNIILKEKPNKLIEVINENNKFIQYDEISGNIIL